MSSQYDRDLREINRLLDKVIRALDAAELPVDGPAGDSVNRTYQLLFTAGDCINQARHHIKNNNRKETN